jgi:hypothetical protein
MSITSLGLRLAKIESQIELLEKHNVVVSTISSVEVTSTPHDPIMLNGEKPVAKNLYSGDPKESKVDFKQTSRGPTISTSTRKANVMYDYTSQNAGTSFHQSSNHRSFNTKADVGGPTGELSVRANDEVFVLADDQDGWTKVRNSLHHNPTCRARLIQSSLVSKG